jgi:hypothetical protein
MANRKVWKYLAIDSCSITYQDYLQQSFPNSVYNADLEMIVIDGVEYYVEHFSIENLGLDITYIYLWYFEQGRIEDTKFSISEIKKYLLKQDSRGDIMFNLSAENILKSQLDEIKEEDL